MTRVGLRMVLQSGVMSVRASGRMATVAGPLVAVASLMLVSCGSSADDVNTKPVITLGDTPETNYQTLPPQTTAPTVSTPASTPVVSSGAPAGEYTIKSGDFPLGLADKFGVELVDLATANGWANCTPSGCASFPGIGTVIQIPAGGTAPDAGSDDTGDDTEDTGSGDTVPSSGDNCDEGSYVIEVGDTTRTKVADKFDVTVEALDAANAGTDGYSAFYPGLKIVIPAKADC